MQQVPEFTSDVLTRLERAYALVREHLGQAAESARVWYNKKVKQCNFKEGDLVRVYNPRRFKGRTPKWQSFYKDVAVVEKRFNDVTYSVKAKGWKKPRIVHVDKLKLVQTFEPAVTGSV